MCLSVRKSSSPAFDGHHNRRRAGGHHQMRVGGTILMPRRGKSLYLRSFRVHHSLSCRKQPSQAGIPIIKDHWQDQDRTPGKCICFRPWEPCILPFLAIPVIVVFPFHPVFPAPLPLVVRNAHRLVKPSTHSSGLSTNNCSVWGNGPMPHKSFLLEHVRALLHRRASSARYH